VGRGCVNVNGGGRNMGPGCIKGGSCVKGGSCMKGGSCVKGGGCVKGGVTAWVAKWGGAMLGAVLGNVGMDVH